MGALEERALAGMAPGQNLIAISKADSDLAVRMRAIRVYVAVGDGPVTLKVTMLGTAGSTPTLTFGEGVFWEPIGVRRVWDTGSSGTCIIHGIPAEVVD